MNRYLRWWATALRWPTAAQAARLEATIRWGAVGAYVGEEVATRLPLQLQAGCTQTDVLAASDVLRSFYGCAAVNVTPDPDRGNRCLVALRPNLAPPPTGYPLSLGTPGGITPRSPYEPLPLGVDHDGVTVGIPLFRRELGATSVLIGGVPGSGKSAALRALLASLAMTTATLLVIDPTGGAEAALWQGRLSAVVDTAEPEPTVHLLAEVLALIERRGRIIGAGGCIDGLSPVVLVCDELAELAAAGTTKQQEEARSMLRRIVALGRKCNVACIFATQRTTAASIDVTTRSLVGWRVALAHPDDPYGSEALLGPGHKEASQLRKEDVGVALLTDGGQPRLVRVFYCSSDLVKRRRLGQSRTLEELEQWDDASLRELAALGSL